MIYKTIRKIFLVMFGIMTFPFILIIALEDSKDFEAYKNNIKNFYK